MGQPADGCRWHERRGNGEFQFRTTSDDNITFITTTGDNWQGFELRTAMENHNNEAGSKDTELRGEDDLILSAQTLAA